jgi:hypothetical protein
MKLLKAEQGLEEWQTAIGRLGAAEGRDFLTHAPSRNTSDASAFNSAARCCRARAEKTKMTELERYLVRMGSKGWMVWDRQARAPARLGRDGRPAIDLTDEQAREIKDELTKKSHSER